MSSIQKEEKYLRLAKKGKKHVKSFTRTSVPKQLLFCHLLPIVITSKFIQSFPTWPRLCSTTPILCSPACLQLGFFTDSRNWSTSKFSSQSLPAIRLLACSPQIKEILLALTFFKIIMMTVKQNIDTTGCNVSTVHDGHKRLRSQNHDNSTWI